MVLQNPPRHESVLIACVMHSGCACPPSHVLEPNPQVHAIAHTVKQLELKMTQIEVTPPPLPVLAPALSDTSRALVHSMAEQMKTFESELSALKQRQRSRRK